MIIFMGTAGSGKSVQGQLLADKLSYPWLSTGEFLRMLIRGKQRKDMLQGKLLGDEEVIALVSKIFSVVDANQEFILDGFPRTTIQTDWLLSQVKQGIQQAITGVIHLNASEEAVQSRLLGRGRQDDHQQAILDRFKEYERLSKPILDRFKSANVPVYNIDGEQSVEAVHQAIMQALGR